MVGTMRKCNDDRPAAAAAARNWSRIDGRQHDRNAAADGGVADERAAANADKLSPGQDSRHGQRSKSKQLQHPAA